jgi:hypothetical protein
MHRNPFRVAGWFELPSCQFAADIAQFGNVDSLAVIAARDGEARSASGAAIP